MVRSIDVVKERHRSIGGEIDLVYIYVYIFSFEYLFFVFYFYLLLFFDRKGIGL